MTQIADAPRLTFDVVIATRNRPEALALSIPLLLGQSRRPEKLIVIDSSDDHAPVAQVVAETTAGHDLEVIVEHSEKGLTRQRNRGLEHVTAEIVFLPDDDSLFYPGTSAAIMEIYERDTEGRVAGVNPAAALEAPEGVLEEAGYAMSDTHTRRARSLKWRTRLGRLLPEAKPLFVIGNLLVERAPSLPWLEQMDAVHVEWMTGYRMTFRTAAIRAEGFEPVFGGYALFEDVDACWAVARHGCILGAHRGRIYHHRFPSGRANHYGLGAMTLANLAYVLAKHASDLELSTDQRAEARRKTHAYARLRMLAARLRALGGNKDAAEDLRGMRAARPAIDRLFDTPRAALPAEYLAVKAELGID